MIAIASAASATPQAIGSIFRDPAADPSVRDVSEEDRARQTMNSYAACLVRTRSVKVSRALARPTAEVQSALAGLADSSCLNDGKLKMSGDLLRGALYRALYLRDFARTAPVSDAAPGAVPASSDVLQQFGYCVDQADPLNARAFVASVPATGAERAALQGLGPALSRCVAPGNNVRFSRSTLQGVLAEAAYRRATGSHTVTK